MRILGIHGIGHADAQTDWQPQWRTAITDGLRTWNPSAAPEFDFLTYDELFEASDLNAPVVLEAFVKLAASGLFYGIADIFRSRRGLGDTLEDMRWTAGMVAQWVALDRLRGQLRSRLAERIRAFQPDVIAAHSLGSLIAYDTLKTDEVANPASPLTAGRTLVTLGSQIGNPAVRATFGGRVEELAKVRFWWHLYNAEDDVFTCPIVLPTQERFRQVDTYFDIPGWADHDGAHYLGHDEATRTVWQDVASTIPRGRALAAAKAPASLARPQLQTARTTARSAPQMRALLVGIADYPDAASRRFHCPAGPAPVGREVGQDQAVALGGDPLGIVERDIPADCLGMGGRRDRERKQAKDRRRPKKLTHLSDPCQFRKRRTSAIAIYIGRLGTLHAEKPLRGVPFVAGPPKLPCRNKTEIAA